jgi:WD40 repeat protein
VVNRMLERSPWLPKWLAPALLVLVIVAMAAPPARAAVPDAFEFTLFGQLNNLSESPTQQSIFPKVAQAEDSVTGAVHVAWREHTDIAYRRLQTLDAAPDARKTLSTGVSGQSDEVDIAASGRYVYVVWAEREFAEEVWFARSRDEGVSFGEPMQISGSAGVTSWFPRVAAHGDDVWIAWEEWEGGPHVAVVHSADGAGSFSAPKDLGATGGSAGALDVAATRTAAHVAFTNTGGDPSASGLFLRSAESGAAFGPPAEVTEHPRPFAIEGSPDGVAIAWSEGDSIKVSAREEPTAGLDLLTIPADCSAGLDCLPQLDVFGDEAILAWVQKDGSEHDIMAGRAEDLGAGFGPPEHVADDATGLSAVRVANGRSYVAWHDAPNRAAPLNAFVAIRRPRVGFKTYHASSRASEADDSFLPQLATDDLGVGVIWSEYGGGTIGASYDPKLFEVLYQPVSFEPSDLRLVDAKAVQAPRDFPELVERKRTAVRLLIDNNGFRVATDVDCSFETGIFSEVPCDRSVELESGLNEIYLRAPGAAAEAGDTRLDVELDPNDKLAETDETNNAASRTYPVRATRPLRVLVLGVAAGGEPATPCADVRQVASQARDFLAGGFPLAERELTVGEDCVGIPVPPVLGEPDLWRISEALDAIKEWRQPYDKVIAAVPSGWFRAHGVAAGGWAPIDAGHDGVIVEVEPDSGATTAHELTHSYGFTEQGDIHVPHRPAPGHWPARGLTFDPGVDWMSDTVVSDSDSWASPQVYRFLLEQLAEDGARRARQAAAEPNASLLLAGGFRGDGSLEARPTFRIEGAPDVPLDAAGELELEYLNGAGAVIARTAFDPTPGAAPAGTDELVGPESFSVRVPDVPGTERLRLTRGARLLLDRRRTPNTPQVTVRSPNGGESLFVGERAEVRWNATDADGDELTSVVLLSTDGGASWRPLATGLTEQRLRFTPTRAEVSDRALVRVVTSDGLNTSEDRSDARFSIESPVRNGRIALVTTHFTEEAEVATLEPDGSDIKRLTSRPGPLEGEAWPTWSPDGTEVAFVQQTGGCFPCEHSIWRMDADGGNLRRVTDPGASALDSEPDWSPDGKKIAFVRHDTVEGREELRIVDLASGAEEVLVPAEGEVPLSSPAWSPDGTEIAYGRSGRVFPQPDFGWRIRKLRADGTQATPDDLGPFSGEGLDWSPDGDQLVLANFGELHVMNSDGSGRRIIAKVHETAGENGDYDRPTWSPDGSRIAVGVFINPSRADVQVMNADGSEVENITEGLRRPGSPTAPSDEVEPSWQPLRGVAEEPPIGPVADAGGHYGAREGREVELDASASNGHGSALEFGWDLDGDGKFDDASGAKASTTFLNEGSYAVAVRVSDARRLADTARAEIAVGNRAPSVGEVVAQVEGGVLERVDAQFSDPGGQDRHTAEVDWGDGGPPEAAEVVLTDDGGRVTATRPAAGPAGRTVTVRVFDDAGEAGEGSATMEAVPANGAPAVDDVAVQTSSGERIDVEVPALDPERDLLRASLARRPGHGEALLLDGPGPVLAGVRVAYTPEAGFAGTDRFDVLIGDGLSSPVTATVSIRVLPEGGGPGGGGPGDGGPLPEGTAPTDEGPFTVSTPRTISLKARKSKRKKGGKTPRLVIKRGRKARFSGDVTAPLDVAGCESNQTVDMQRRKRKRTAFTTFRNVETDAAGSFSFKKRIRRTFRYRAVLGQTATCAEAVSATVKVKKKRKKK